MTQPAPSAVPATETGIVELSPVLTPELAAAIAGTVAASKSENTRRAYVSTGAASNAGARPVATCPRIR